MESTLGGRIAEFRKQRGFTQERLAEAVGVSAAAVSKWETGASQPDIGIICPLARALGTNVDTLLSFEVELSAEEVVERVNVIGETARKGDLKKAEEALEALLHTYPSSIPLKFNGAGVLILFEMLFPMEPEEKKAAWKAQRRKLLEEVRASGSIAYGQSATGMLISYEMQDGNLDEAERLIQELPEMSVDASMHWAQLYLRREMPEKALEVTQKRLYVLARQLLLCISMLANEKMIPDGGRRLKILKVYSRAEELLGLGGGTTEGLFAEVYRSLGWEEAEKQSFLKMMKAAMEPLRTPNPVLFSPNVTIEEDKNKMTPELKRVLLEGLKKDEKYEKFQEDREFREMLEALRRDVEGEG